MTTSTRSGEWTYCAELCAALRPYGVNIVLAVVDGRLSSWQRQQIGRLAQVQIYECGSSAQNPELSTYDETVAQQLLDLEHQSHPDIVHLNHLVYGGLNWRAPVLLAGHWCEISRSHALKESPAVVIARQKNRLRIKAGLQRASMVVASTTSMLADLCTIYGSVETGTIIVNGRSFPGLLPAPELKVPVMEPMILCSGDPLDKTKNLSAVMEIADQLPWRVCVARDSDLLNFQSSFPLPTNVRELGFVPEHKLAHWLARASIYTAPSYYEPFGFGILEAARAGCALVLGDIANLREIWGDAAEYVDPDDPADLLRVINQLIDHPKRLREMMERAWRRAQRYSDSRMAAGYLHSYRQIQDTHIPVLYPEPQIYSRPFTGVVHS